MQDQLSFTKAPWSRRHFLKASAVTGLGLVFTRSPAPAGPAIRADFEKLVPADKRLSPAWVKSLFERGTPQTLRGAFLAPPASGHCRYTSNVAAR